MLAVEKDNLLAATNQQIAHLRERELAFYVNHIGSIQTIATLVAGFAFSALVKMDSTLDMNMLVFTQAGGFESTTNATSGESMMLPMRRNMDAVQIFAFAMQVLELTTVIQTLGEMLHVLTDSLTSRLLGTRLALRGPDGSINRATQKLAASLAATTRTFFNGLQYFLWSVIFHVLRAQHPAVGVWTILLLYPYWRSYGALAAQRVIDFHIEHGTSTAFEESSPPPLVPTEGAVMAVDAGAARLSALEAGTLWESQGSAHELAGSRQPAAARARTLAVALHNFLNPVGHRLAFLSTTVDDFAGPNGCHLGEVSHRIPAAATHHLIASTERGQVETAEAIDRAHRPMSSLFSPRVGGLMRHALGIGGSAPASDWSATFGFARTPRQPQPPLINHSTGVDGAALTAAHKPALTVDTSSPSTRASSDGNVTEGGTLTLSTAESASPITACAISAGGEPPFGADSSPSGAPPPPTALFSPHVGSQPPPVSTSPAPRSSPMPGRSPPPTGHSPAPASSASASPAPASPDSGKFRAISRSRSRLQATSSAAARMGIRLGGSSSRHATLSTPEPTPKDPNSTPKAYLAFRPSEAASSDSPDANVAAKREIEFSAARAPNSDEPELVV